MIQMICSQDSTLLAELEDKWWKKKAPKCAFIIKDGKIIYNSILNPGKPVLTCTSCNHSGLRRIIYKRIGNNK